MNSQNECISNDKKAKTYIVLDNGTDFRSVAKLMTKAGHPMNHATARNVWLSATANFIKVLSKDLGVDISENAIQELLTREDIHDAIADILYLTYNNSK